MAEAALTSVLMVNREVAPLAVGVTFAGENVQLVFTGRLLQLRVKGWLKPFTAANVKVAVPV